MFARIVTKSSRGAPLVASTSTSSYLPFNNHPSFQSQQTTQFSTSTSLYESKRLRKARIVRKAHIEKKAQLVRQLEQNQPDPILGYSTTTTTNSNNRTTNSFSSTGGVGEEQTLWRTCLLKQTLLKREELWSGLKERASSSSTSSSSSSTTPSKTKNEPDYYNFGLSSQQVDLLTRTLPNVAMMKDVLTPSNRLISQELNEKRLNKAEEREIEKKDKLVRILDLGNAGSKGIQVENIRRIVKTFGRDENDTGRSEVQAAILTARIHGLLEHLVAQPRDVHNRRPLRAMIQDRAKILKYLKSVDVRRYEECLKNIGVEPRAVEGEVIVTKQTLSRLIRGV